MRVRHSDFTPANHKSRTKIKIIHKYKTEIKWAIIFTIVMLMWMTLEKLTGLHNEHIDKHPIYTNFVSIPAIAVYVFALLNKRKSDYNGIMSYNQGVITGIIITIFVTILSPFIQLITSSIITPEYFPNVIEYSVNQGLMTEEVANNVFNLKSYIIQATIGAFIMGLITSVIVAFFTKNIKVQTQE